MRVRVFSSVLIRDEMPKEDLKKLTADFRKYKETGELPRHFGRDAAYDHLDTFAMLRTSDLRHLHLTDGSIKNVRKLQFHRTSDKHLVYCQGTNENNYLLLAVLDPNAHEQARNKDRMIRLVEISERFKSIDMSL